MFLPENIDLSKPEKYLLSLRIKADSFSFFIYDREDADCYCYQQAAFSGEATLFNNIQRIIFDYNFLTENFGRVSVVYVSPNFELIPASFLEKKKADKFYSFTRTDEISHLLISEDRNEDYRLIYNVDEEIHLFLKRSLFNPEFYHYNDLLIGSFKGKVASVQANKMILHFHEESTDMVCFNEKNNILFDQAYSKEHPQDIVYYVLNVWEKLGFNQLTDQLLVSGESDGKKVENILKDYIQHVHPVDWSGFNENWREIPLDLLILTTCE